MIHFEREEFEQAKSDLVRSLDLDKHSFILNMTLGQTYLILEDYGNAYQKLSECEAYAEGDEELGHRSISGGHRLLRGLTVRRRLPAKLEQSAQTA